MSKILYGIVCIISIVYAHTLIAGTLSCSMATSCTNGSIIYKTSSTTNAHAEKASSTNYTRMLCCTNVKNIGNSCTGNFATVLKLSSTTNAHVEQNTFVNYAEQVCLSAPTGASISVGYQAANCTGWDTTLGSMSAATNAHIGDPSAYNTKICATASDAPQSLTFSISDATIGFGTLLSAAARYATGDILGSGSDTSAHTISASTNAENGYNITISGSTLTCSSCGPDTITAIGATPTASSPGTSQFGIRSIPTGTGSVLSPYNTASWALDTASFPDPIISGLGDGLTTNYAMHYLTNISSLTKAGNYTTVITYTITSSF